MYTENNTTTPECQFNTQAVINSLPTTFTHNAFGEVRIIILGEEPWFVAKDIAGMLGYSDTNAMTRYLDEDESMSVKLTGMNMAHTIISEPGFYSAVIRSRVPGAQKVKRWITHDILPSIRKHGMYGTPDFIESALADPDTMIRTLQALKEAQQQRDHAIKTKAWISRKREATAMNTASQFSKENTRLREQIGNSKTFKQARAIPWLKDYFRLDNTAYIQIGKKLTKESKAMGYKIKQAPHSRYGSVKVYHADVIQHFKHKLISDLNFMRRYRKY